MCSRFKQLEKLLLRSLVMARCDVGHSWSGGDSSAVRDQLKNVQQIQSTHHAFAAILRDGSVVTWALLAAVVTAVASEIS